MSLDNIDKRATAYKSKVRVTYKIVKGYIEATYGFKVHTSYIVKRHFLHCKLNYSNSFIVS